MLLMSLTTVLGTLLGGTRFSGNKPIMLTGYCSIRKNWTLQVASWTWEAFRCHMKSTDTFAHYLVHQAPSLGYEFAISNSQQQHKVEPLHQNKAGQTPVCAVIDTTSCCIRDWHPACARHAGRLQKTAAWTIMRVCRTQGEHSQPLQHPQQAEESLEAPCPACSRALIEARTCPLHVEYALESPCSPVCCNKSTSWGDWIQDRISIVLGRGAFGTSTAKADNGRDNWLFTFTSAMASTCWSVSCWTGLWNGLPGGLSALWYHCNTDGVPSLLYSCCLSDWKASWLLSASTIVMDPLSLNCCCVAAFQLQISTQLFFARCLDL